MQPYTYSRPASAKHVFFWLSGAGTETLEACPNWEQRKYVAFGATVLVPCLFAFIACSYALSTLTDNYAVVFLVAVVWAFIILTIDRALLASYRPFLSFWRKVGQFLLRFFVAFLMGLTIAHPLVLLLFRDTITTVIEKDRQAEIEQLHASYATERATAEARIATVEKSIAEQRLRWNETFQAQFKVDPVLEKTSIPGLTFDQQTQLDKAITDATAPAKQSLGAAEQQIATLTPQYAKMQQELAFWQSEFERELNGQRSGIIGLGPRARSVQDDQLAWRREEVRRLGGLLDHFSAEKAALESQIRQAETSATQSFQARLAEEQAKQTAEEQRVAGLKHRVEADQASQFVAQQNQLRETIKAQIDARLGDLKFAQAELARIASEEQKRVDILRAEPRRDILTQTLALHRLFEVGDRGGRFAYLTYVVLTLLFVLLDTIPLMVKFFCKPGPYDTLLDRDEVRFDSEHRAFLVSHKQYMDQLAAGNALAVTRNKPLEEALIDGVEHTRAAREFLDSLIALEKTFHEKLQLEQAAAENGQPEKLAALEMMKKRFYDDLHYRIESFFTMRGRAEV